MATDIKDVIQPLVLSKVKPRIGQNSFMVDLKDLHDETSTCKQRN